MQINLLNNAEDKNYYKNKISRVFFQTIFKRLYW